MITSGVCSSALPAGFDRKAVEISFVSVPLLDASIFTLPRSLTSTTATCVPNFFDSFWQ